MVKFNFKEFWKEIKEPNLIIDASEEILAMLEVFECLMDITIIDHLKDEYPSVIVGVALFRLLSLDKIDIVDDKFFILKNQDLIEIEAVT